MQRRCQSTRLWCAPLAVTAALWLALGSGSGRPALWVPGDDAPARIVIREAGEGEEPLVVRGQVLAPDGVTPAAGVALYVYHTDAGGRYADRPGPPRLRGWMRTDAEGRYEYRTIRPGAYPGRRTAAHVHTQLWGGGWPAQWNRDLLFADDPLVGDGERRRSAAAGRFAWVCDAERDERGVWHCGHDLRLKPTGDAFEDNIRHGLAGPPGGSGA